MNVRILYPTRAAMETRAVVPFSSTDRTAAVLRGPNFVCVQEYEDEGEDLEICETAFHATNAPSQHLPLAQYRLLTRLAEAVKRVGASHTSMSVGDGIEIEGRLYVCASFGFERVEG
jgi:hypothetical protein